MYKILFNLAVTSVILIASTAQASAASLILNGGFESGFSGWTRVDQAGSAGSFLLQTGTLSPTNGFTVPAPPEGTTAAMSDSEGPGSHVLYQDFVVPTGDFSFLLTLQLFINNGDTTFRTPSTLSFSTPTLNQQFRIDIISTTADVFSVAGAGILQNVYQTQAGDPLVSGYNLISANLTDVLKANAGQTLRLRFAEVDNVSFFNAGLDDIQINPSQVPEPSTYIAGGGLLVLAWMRSRK